MENGKFPNTARHDTEKLQNTVDDPVDDPVDESGSGETSKIVNP